MKVKPSDMKVGQVWVIGKAELEILSAIIATFLFNLQNYFLFQFLLHLSHSLTSSLSLTQS